MRPVLSLAAHLNGRTWAEQLRGARVPISGDTPFRTAPTAKSAQSQIKIPRRPMCNRRRLAWDHSGKTRQERGYGKDHERIRAELLRDVVFCEECTRQGRKFRFGNIADHVIPLAKGGKTERSNYQLLCKSCSNKKTILDGGRKVRRRAIGADGWPLEES